MKELSEFERGYLAAVKEQKEKLNARQRRNYHKNPTKVLERTSKYYYEHKEQISKRQSRYYQAHREERMAYSKKYYHAHKETIQAKVKVKLAEKAKGAEQ